MSYSPLAPQWTEDAIKDVLDGTFTRVNYEGKITIFEVDDDHTPKGPTSCGGRPAGLTGHKQVFWVPEEEEILITQRKLDRSFAEIAWLLSRSIEATKKHHKILRARGRV